MDFLGNPTETTSYHFKNGEIMIIEDYYNYDHANRLVSHKQKSCNFPIGEEYLALYPEFITCNPEELIVLNTYDELGQLENKKVGGSVATNIENSKGLQTIDYTYNVRGWLKQINDPSILGSDLFGFKINYNTNDHGGTNLFNGNIAETEWKTANTDNSLKWYKYGYDALNRITYGINENGRYNLASSTSPITYDKNGNITFLTRKGHIVENPDAANSSHFGDMDRIYYYYETTSNKLRKVADFKNDDFGFVDGNSNGDDYSYDANGNMIEDLNKGITNITYNHLNLPTVVSIDGAYTGTISYIYDATGVKLSKSVVEYETPTSTDTETLDYAGNYVYKSTGSHSLVNGNWQGHTLFHGLQYYSHPEGYVDPSGSGYNYVFQYKDHLGNVRLSYKDANGNYEEILNSDFDGWEENGSVNYTLENGRLKTNVNSPWEGVRKPLSGVTTVAGEKLTVKVNFDKGNTQSNVRLYLPEYNSSGTLVRYNVIEGNLQSGYSEHTLTMLDTGNSIGYIRIDKDNTNTSSETYFYIDHVSVLRNDLEILEENNYYPFGLKHKGYNGNVASTNIAQNYKYNGKELNEELGLNWHDYGARNYDAALGRWMNIDNKAEKFESWSTYNYTLNNPIYFIDPNGEEVWIIFDKTHNRLYVYDMDNYDPNRETKVVKASEYKFNFKKKEKKYNQLLVIDNVFSGGNNRTSDEEVQYETNAWEVPIPNGEFDLLDYEGTGRKSEWYRVDAQDSKPYNDKYDVEGVTNAGGETRGEFRLHRGNASHGCITVCKKSTNDRSVEWKVLDKIIQSTSTVEVPNNQGREKYIPGSTVTKYGTITVEGEQPK